MKRFVCGALCAALMAGNFLIPAAAVEFSDTKGHWGESAIAQVTDWKLFSGGDDGTFAPDMAMSRAMFVTVMAQTARKLGAYEQPELKAEFSDVAQGDYFAEYVSWAKENGLVDGAGNGKFIPHAAVSRQDMCVIMDKFLEKFTAIEIEQEAEITFADWAQVSEYAKDSVNSCVAAGVISGATGANGEKVFYPMKSASRAEVAAVMCALVNTIEAQAELPVLPEEPEIGGGAGGVIPDEPEQQPDEDQPTQEEMEEEAKMAGYLENLVTGYENSTYLLTTEQPVQDAMAILMGCIEDALEEREKGEFLSRSFIRKEYDDQIDDLRDSYKSMTEKQLNQMNNVIVRLGDSEEIYFVMDYFGVDAPV